MRSQLSEDLIEILPLVEPKVVRIANEGLGDPCHGNLITPLFTCFILFTASLK